MDEKSFSLHFNPVTNVKSVKDYEEEINALRNEVFDLKTQLTHKSNVPKLLYDNSKAVQEMEREKLKYEAEYKKAISDLRGAEQEFTLMKSEISTLQNDCSYLREQNSKLNSENSILNQNVFVSNEKIALLEDENRRLLGRIEKINPEYSRMKNMHEEMENDSIQLKNIINKIELEKNSCIAELQDENSELQRRIDTYRDQVNESTVSKTREFEQKTREYEERCRYYEEKCREYEDKMQDHTRAVATELGNNEQFINELKSKLQNLIQEKREMEEHNFQQEKDLTEIISKSNQSIKLYTGLLNKINGIFNTRMYNLGMMAGELSSKISMLQKRFEISDQNKKLVAGLKLGKFNLDKILDSFRRISAVGRQRNAGAEMDDNTLFSAMGNQSNETVRKLTEQVYESMVEINIIQKYLQEKGKEIKALKSENAVLRREESKKDRLMNEMRLRSYGTGVMQGK